ncbi:hypothetical protein NE237_028334 [Protea cynaroides]|uniref:Uncharacterized protein n=1 Tax=Protea cynaroides TaxID=273540 RepID=A0A9Q0GP50_9MAGN|nr:hypothetical protein NE237_028334 [Protea cynaroides]
MKHWQSEIHPKACKKEKSHLTSANLSPEVVAGEAPSLSLSLSLSLFLLTIKPEIPFALDVFLPFFFTFYYSSIFLVHPCFGRNSNQQGMVSISLTLLRFFKFVLYDRVNQTLVASDDVKIGAKNRNFDS